MAKGDLSAARFEESRADLRAVAYRMLGSATEADDAVQEAWLRASRADTSEVDHLGRWLATVVARVCLDMLRARKARREDLGDAVESAHAIGPDQDKLLTESVGLALMVVLEKLTPAERVAFVLHDTFDFPFDEIASIVGSTSAAARKLASRARRRVLGANPDADADITHQREVVAAFFAASRHGDLNALLAVLDPDVVLRPDRAAIAASAANPGAPQFTGKVLGAANVARTFLGRAQAARAAIVDGFAGAAFAPDGEPRAVFDITVVGGKIVDIAVIADPTHIRALSVSVA